MSRKTFEDVAGEVEPVGSVAEVDTRQPKRVRKGKGKEPLSKENPESESEGPSADAVTEEWSRKDQGKDFSILESQIGFVLASIITIHEKYECPYALGGIQQHLLDAMLNLRALWSSNSAVTIAEVKAAQEAIQKQWENIDKEGRLSYF